MASSKLTLIGLYNYDNTIFDNMKLPIGIEKDILINNILMSCGEFEILYPKLDFLKWQIGIWSRKWYRTMNKWVKALSINYDPLSNYDRTETWTDTNNGTSTETIANDTTNTHTSTGSATDISTGSGNGTSENTVSAYDSNSYVPHDKNTNNTTTSNNSTSNTTANGTDTIDNDITRNGNNSNTTTHTGRMYGNIGVTTSQQMLQSELDIATWNVYEHITDIFAKEFCIMIY